MAGNTLSTGLVKIAAACKGRTKHIKVLDLQCNSVNHSTVIIDLASVIGTINSLEALSLGSLNMSTKDKIFDNFVLNLKMMSLYNFTSGLKLPEDYRFIEILSLEIRKSNFIYKVQINYDLTKTLYNDFDTLYDLFEVTEKSSFKDRTYHK